MSASRGATSVHPQHIAGLIMGDDEVGDSIENFYPVPISLLQANEETSVFEGDGGLAADRLQQLAVRFRKGRWRIDQAKRAQQFARRTAQCRQ